MSININSLRKFVPLLFTLYPIGLVRARAVLDRIDTLHEKHADAKQAIAAAAEQYGKFLRLPVVLAKVEPPDGL